MHFSLPHLLMISVIGWSFAGSGIQEAASEERIQGKQQLPEVWQPTEMSREWKYLVFHHSASEQGSVESIDRDHRSRKDSQGNPWLGIGYHFVIGNGHGMEDGQIEPTFRWKEQRSGAHAGNKQYNDEGIGICLIGNFEKKAPTDRQIQACQKLVQQLSSHFEIPPDKFIRHSKIKPTACPGKLFPQTSNFQN